jgi:predicted DNA-binding transcriptional regulator
MRFSNVGYFYQYTPPRPLEEIRADIQAIEKDITVDQLSQLIYPLL